REPNRSWSCTCPCRRSKTCNLRAPETAPCPSTLHEAQEEGQEKPLLCGAFREPSNGLEPLTPSLPSRVPGKRMQLQAASCKESRSFRSRGVCSHLQGFASALLHKCSIPTGAPRRDRPLSS